MNITFQETVKLLCSGLYLFLLAVSRIQIKKIKHEAIGLVIVLVAPFTFLWIFPWKKIVLCGTISIHSLKFYWLYNILLPTCTYMRYLTGSTYETLRENGAIRLHNYHTRQQLKI